MNAQIHLSDNSLLATLTINGILLGIFSEVENYVVEGAPYITNKY